MKILRLILSAVAVLFLLGGYLASQLAALNNAAPTYAVQADSPPVRAFASLLFLAAVVLAFFPEREASP